MLLLLLLLSLLCPSEQATTCQSDSDCPTGYRCGAANCIISPDNNNNDDNNDNDNNNDKGNNNNADWGLSIESNAEVPQQTIFFNTTKSSSNNNKNNHNNNKNIHHHNKNNNNNNKKGLSDESNSAQVASSSGSSDEVTTKSRSKSKNQDDTKKEKKKKEQRKLVTATLEAIERERKRVEEKTSTPTMMLMMEEDMEDMAESFEEEDMLMEAEKGSTVASLDSGGGGADYAEEGGDASSSKASLGTHSVTDGMHQQSASTMVADSSTLHSLSSMALDIKSVDSTAISSAIPDQQRLLKAGLGDVAAAVPAVAVPPPPAAVPAVSVPAVAAIPAIPAMTAADMCKNDQMCKDNGFCSFGICVAQKLLRYKPSQLCSKEKPCPNGNECLSGWCRAQCGGVGDCKGGPNLICFRGNCLPKCLDDEDCLHSKGLCDKSSGECRMSTGMDKGGVTLPQVYKMQIGPTVTNPTVAPVGNLTVNSAVAAVPADVQVLGPTQKELPGTITVQKYDDFGCDCGGAKPPNAHTHKQPPLKQRIVGGRNVKEPVKWIAYLQLVRNSQADFCTGSLINSMFVLSAAHCACMDEIQKPACSLKDNSVKINYDPMAMEVKIFLGITTRAQLQSERSFSVSAVIVHPDYRLDNPNAANDVALFKLSERIQSNHPTIQPVCLPDSERFLEPKSAVVAGWGFQYKDCQTDFWGPKKFLPCADEWIFANRTFRQTCERSLDPPMHPTCTEFYTAASESRVQPMGPVFVESEEGRVECPPKRPPVNDYYGWCGSCAGAAAPGGDTPSCEPANDRNWGFCDKLCTVETLPTTLQELHLTVVEDAECQALLNNNASLVKIDVEKELCAGKKNYIPHFPVYSKVRNGTNVTFTQALNKEDIVVTEYKYVFGGKDSCSGDSGGPMWTWALREGETVAKAIQIGVVSRGEGCAKFGSPGVYSRVKRLLSWIKTTSAEGRCGA